MEDYTICPECGEKLNTVLYVEEGVSIQTEYMINHETEQAEKIDVDTFGDDGEIIIMCPHCYTNLKDEYSEYYLDLIEN